MHNQSLPGNPGNFRYVAILPLIFFLAQAIHYLQINELGHMLWMCNIGNLVLAIGIFREQRILIRVAVIWAIPGLIVWCIYVVPTWGMLLTGRFSWTEFFGVISSTLAHVGGLSLGIVVLRKFKMDKRTWTFAFVWYLILQLASRLFTPATMNVNLAHRVQDGFEQTFTSYWKFWIVLTLIVALGAWVLGEVLRRIWPEHELR